MPSRLAADVIVLASPIYFYSMTSQMKAVIDRTYAFFSQLAGKAFYFLITCAATDAIEADDIRQSDAMQQAYLMGRSL